MGYNTPSVEKVSRRANVVWEVTGRVRSAAIRGLKSKGVKSRNGGLPSVGREGGISIG